MKPGPKIDVKKDEKIKSLRDKGLSFREIGRVMNLNVNTVYERYKRAVGELSTDGVRKL